jgi:ubiquinone biosynthesis protein Coq4
MLGTLLLIYLIKKMVLTFVYFLQEAAVQQELTVNIIIEFLHSKIVKQLIKQKIFLEELDLAHLEKI